MVRGQIALVAVVLISFSVVPGPTAAQSRALSEAQRTHLRGEQFMTVTSVTGLPLVVRDSLKGLFGGSTLALANPGAEFQATDVVMKPNLPIRRLILAGCSADHCLVYYERGGIAHTRYVMLFQWRNTGSPFEWGGSAPAGLANLEEVKSAVLSGAVRGQTEYW
jgi:hypothetical protein